MQRRVLILGTTIILLAAGALLAPPIPQDPDYHQFADLRPWQHLPNAGDVLSNLPYLLFGLLGFRTVLRLPATHFLVSGERHLWLFFFLCIGLVFFGSSYYHLAPDNARLVWDRIPIALAFMALFSLILAERLHPKALHVLWLLVPAAVASIFLWYGTELEGRSDLRPYLLVQVIPITTIPLLLWLFPARYSHSRYYVLMLGWYLLAKVLEFNDRTVFEVTSHLISGHSLKHLASALSAYMAVRLLPRRKPVQATLA